MTSPILNTAKSTSPTGVGKDPTPLEGVLSNAPTWYRTEELFAEYARLQKLKLSAVQRLLNAFNDLQRREQRTVKPAIQGESVVVSDSATSTTYKVIGYVYMGPHLEPATLIASSPLSPKVQLSADEWDRIRQGMDDIGVQLAKQNIRRAKEELAAVDRETGDLVALAGKELEQIHLGKAASEQSVGRDHAAEASIENAKRTLEERLKDTLERTRRAEGPLTEEQLQDVLSGVEAAQWGLLPEDHPTVRELMELIYQRTKAGDLGLIPEAAPSAPLPKVVVVIPQDRDEFRRHNVEPGESLWIIAKRYYGNGELWRVIFEANRGVVTNPDLIQPGVILKIPAKG